jgi:D-alanyl-D-alanine carboxypeptidase/D-alanyl-D-alanine-endopeptidase (penicillin-binding protein 4)
MRSRNNYRAIFVSLLLLLALNLCALPQPRAQEPQPTQQQQQRERRTTPPVSAPSPSPAQTPADQPRPATQGAEATQAARGARTLQELQARISEVLRRPELAAATVGVKVVSLDTGRTVYEENAQKLLRPASNMKIYTVAAALDRLSPDYHFTTSVYARSRPDAAGVLRGDLLVYGRGDPSIAARFNNGDYFKVIDDLAGRVAAAGVKRVEGDLVGDETYFVGPPLGDGWEWDDLTWWYGAEVSALTVNDNALDLSVKPGASVGSPCVITTGRRPPCSHSSTARPQSRRAANAS